MQPLFLDSGRLLICSPSYVDAFSNVQDAVRVPAGILLFWLPVFHVITLMTLGWRDIFDPAVLMFKVVPVYKTVYPYSGIINSAKTVLRPPGTIFESPEQRF